MTLYQIRTYLAKTDELGAGTFRASSAEAADAALKIQESRRLRGLT